MRLLAVHSLMLIGISILMMGCSTSLPLSEAVIFTGDEVHSDSLKWHSSAALAYSSNNQTGAIKQYIREVSNRPIRDNDFWNLNKQGYGIAMAKNMGSLSMGINIGLRLLGVNATANLGYDNYITANLAANGGAELIFQRKVIHKKSGAITGGMALGLFGKRDYFAIEGLETMSGPDLKYINIFGGRSMVHLQGDELGLHGFLSYGYSPEIDAGILNIGIAIAVDTFRKVLN